MNQYLKFAVGTRWGLIKDIPPYFKAGMLVEVTQACDNDNDIKIKIVKPGGDGLNLYVGAEDLLKATADDESELLKVGRYVVLNEPDTEFKIPGSVLQVMEVDEDDDTQTYRCSLVGGIKDIRYWVFNKRLTPLPEDWHPWSEDRKLIALVDSPNSIPVKKGTELFVDKEKNSGFSVHVYFIDEDGSRSGGWLLSTGTQNKYYKFALDETKNESATENDAPSNETGETNMNQVTQGTPNDKAFENRDITIARAGTKIILPDDPREMTYDEGIEALKRMKQQDSVKVDVFEEVDAFPLEGAWALMQVLKKMYGYVMQTQSIFGATSTMVTLEVGPNKKDQVIWGEFQVPGVTGKLQTGVHRKDGQLMFVITGTVLKKEQGQIKEIADAVRDYVSQNSLYRGKAVRINTAEVDGTYQVDFRQPPKFLDLSKVNEEELTFSDDVRSLVQTNLFTPIERTAECRAAGIPLKRSVLLEGTFGTGKTLTALVGAKKAEKHGWTFIYLDRPQALREILIFARRYAPAIIFAEDIDRVVSGKRDQKIDDVMNNIDGMDSKGHEVICVFTTNEIDKIEPGMLRAGRLDAVITVSPPDAKAAEKLMRIYSKGLLAEDADLSAAGKELAGTIPAFIREVVERSKLYAIGRLQPGEKLALTGEDLRICAVGMKHHIALVNPPKKDALTAGDKLARALNEVIQGDNYDSEEEAKAHRIAVDREARLQ